MKRSVLAAATILLFLQPRASGAAGGSADSAAWADSAAAAPTAPRAWPAGLVRADRLQHASLAFTLGLGTGIVTRQPAAAVSTAFALGLAKEIRDRRHEGFDPVDLLADAVGAALAALATRSLPR